LIYRSFERIAINRAYVRTQDYPNDPNNLLTITREDVLRDMKAMEAEILSIGRELMEKGKDLKTIKAEYSIAGQSVTRNCIEAVLSERYGFFDIALAGRKAKNVTLRMYYGGQVNGTSGNAFQHAYWNAEMTNRAGADIAKLFGDAHEFGLDMSEIEYLSDLENNMRGREAAINGMGSAKDIENMVNEGRLVQYPYQGRIDDNGEWLPGLEQILPTDGNASYVLHPDLPPNDPPDQLY